MAKEGKLKRIAAQIEKCRRCLLWKSPKAVPGTGDPDSEVMFIGEAPGFHESRQGLPFVGVAGKLLDKLLKDIGLERNEVFICNMLRHRPPGNRDPLPEEIEACRSFLDEQIQIIKPKIIVTLGRFSMNKFLPGEKISRIHGQARYVDFLGKRYIVVPMYHPAAALRNGRIMEEIKEDFQKIKVFLEENPEEEIMEKNREDKQLKLV
ncbi:uracil-DNA glycosylase [Patescibacteria group bacterium]|nr:uracil-DNA glycosylase [Patescibacteria group bacterium]